MRLTNPLTYKYLPFSQAMFTLVQVNGYSNKQECGFIIKYLCTAESKFFSSSRKHGGFQSPKFPSVKPEVSFCQTLSFYLSKCFFLSNPVFLSSQKFSPVNSESCSCQTWIFLLSNPKFPPVKLEVASLRIASFWGVWRFQEK